jgi:hypothetical protein
MFKQKDMNEYIIYTAEGSTMSPNEDEVENCQVLGVVTAINAKLAPTALVRQFPAVKDWGFKMSKTFVRQVVTKKQQTELKKLLNALTAKNSDYKSDPKLESAIWALSELVNG